MSTQSKGLLRTWMKRPPLRSLRTLWLSGLKRTEPSQFPQLRIQHHPGAWIALTNIVFRWMGRTTTRTAGMASMYLSSIQEFAPLIKILAVVRILAQISSVMARTALTATGMGLTWQAPLAALPTGWPKTLTSLL